MKAFIEYDPNDFPRYTWKLIRADGDPDWLETIIAGGIAFTEAGATRAALRAWRRVLKRGGKRTKEVPLP